MKRTIDKSKDKGYEGRCYDPNISRPLTPADIGGKQGIIYVRFAEDLFSKNEIIETQSYKAKVISIPKNHYSKWYWRILHFITFKLLFEARITYKLKLIK